jgi:uncharacterized protein YjiS (DUF1127 family)
MIMSAFEAVRHAPARLVTDRGSDALGWLFRWLTVAFAVARERRALMALSDDALKDIGLSRADAYREGTRPIWDLPVDRLH